MTFGEMFLSVIYFGHVMLKADIIRATRQKESIDFCTRGVLQAGNARVCFPSSYCVFQPGSSA
jgi:hypothetical protein